MIESVKTRGVVAAKTFMNWNFTNLIVGEFLTASFAVYLSKMISAFIVCPIWHLLNLTITDLIVLN